LGATQAVETIEEATDLAKSMTNGQGADSVVVSVGVTTGEHVGQAMNAIRKAGTVVVTGAGPVKVSDVPINLIDLTMSQKRIVGALYGMSSPREAIPRLASLYKAGRLKLEEMVTKEYTLDEVAQGYEDMHAGTIIRGMVSFR